MKLNFLLYLIFPLSSYARGGHVGDGTIFFGLICVFIAFVLSRIVGEILMPNGDKSLQTFIGFFAILFAVALVGSIFR